MMDLAEKDFKNNRFVDAPRTTGRCVVSQENNI
jgi:hypothetical protein